MNKEKQIEEMASIAYPGLDHQTVFSSIVYAQPLVNLYNAGYRKQSEGEWETIPHRPRAEMFNAYSHICSACKYFYKDVRPIGYKFCPNCGAKMKGV